MTTNKQFGKQLSNKTGASGLRSDVAAVLRKPKLWARPIIAAVVLGAVGWFVNRSIEQAMHKQLGEQLTTILNAEVEAVRIWFTEQRVDAELIAASGPVLASSRALLAQKAEPDRTLHEAREQDALRSYLAPRLKRYGYTDFFLVADSLRIVGSNVDAAVGTPLEGYNVTFCKEVLGGHAAVSKPFPSVFALPDEKGERRVGVPTVLAAAPIHDDAGRVIGVLAVRIPESRFTTILRIAQTGETGETYAFDEKGLFLSESRFDDDLKRIGLLADTPGSRSILTLELRDPEVNMAAGERPRQTRAEQPLTRMAADAVKGGAGIDVAGYRDYRGVPVIGAWRWLPEFDFGIATEIDVAEAYGPLAILHWTFLSLFALLVLAAASIFVYMIIVARQQAHVANVERMISQLGQYTLEDKIGSGGMGSVYRARHAFLRRPTAVKLLNAANVTAEAAARFEREVQLTSQLLHPNTIAIYDFGRTPEGVFYYAMEYLEGIDLEDLVDQFGPLPDGRVLEILKQVCASLSEAHVGGLIHRDIKPANIILTNRARIPDFVKVLDFGLAKALGADGDAKLTAANVTVGTPHYMSPEAVERPDTITALSDIYSIGAVGYYLLTGTEVFDGKTVMEICMKQVKATPEAPSKRIEGAISPQLEALILRCLAKKPADRVPSTLALIEELQRCEPSQRWTQADAVAWWNAFVPEGQSRPQTSPPSAQQTALHPEEGGG